MNVIKLEINTDGLQQKFAVAYERAADLTGPLTRFGGYLRKKAIGKYRAQDFVGLAQSTLERRAEKGFHSLERKLTRDVKRAYQRQEGQKPPRGFLQRALAAMGAEPGGAVVSGAQTRGVRNRLAVLAEFQRRHGRSVLVSDAATARPLTLKQLSSLDQREARAISRAVSKPILNGLVDTVGFDVDYDTVTLRSMTVTKFSAVHNDGGTAGHGARIPKRETIAIDSDDVGVLLEMLRDRCFVEVFEGD